MLQIDGDAPFPQHRALARAKPIEVRPKKSKRIDERPVAASEAPIVTIGRPGQQTPHRSGQESTSPEGDRLLLWPEISSGAEFAARDARIYPRLHLFALRMALPRSRR